MGCSKKNFSSFYFKNSNEARIKIKKITLNLLNKQFNSLNDKIKEKSLPKTKISKNNNHNILYLSKINFYALNLNTYLTGKIKDPNGLRVEQGINLLNYISILSLET